MFNSQEVKGVVLARVADYPAGCSNFWFAISMNDEDDETGSTSSDAAAEEGMEFLLEHG